MADVPEFRATAFKFLLNTSSIDLSKLAMFGPTVLIQLDSIVVLK